MSHDIFSRPSNAFRQHFKHRFPSLTVSRWREVLAAAMSFPVMAGIRMSHQAQDSDAMFNAEAIILDREYCRMRLEDFCVEVNDQLLNEIRACLRIFWEQKGHPCPPMFWSLREYCSTYPMSDQTMPVPFALFSRDGRYPIDTTWWQATIKADAVPELPAGLIKPHEEPGPGGEMFIALPVTMMIKGHTAADLPPSHRALFPTKGFPAVCLLSLFGPRGISFEGFEEMEASAYASFDTDSV